MTNPEKNTTAPATSTAAELGASALAQAEESTREELSEARRQLVFRATGMRRRLDRIITEMAEPESAPSSTDSMLSDAADFERDLAELNHQIKLLRKIRLLRRQMTGS